MKTIDSGGLGLTSIKESSGAAFLPEELLPEFKPDVFEEAPVVRSDAYYNEEKGKLVTSIHGWLFRHAGKLILVDTGRGRRQEQGIDQAPFFVSLTEAGVTPAEIDIVLLTHFHTDHIKNNTLFQGGSWVPAFPNARYIAGKREHDHWYPGGAGLTIFPRQASLMETAVDPLSQAGQLDLIVDDAEILPGLRARCVPGHTITQLAYVLESEQNIFLFAADSFHHPVQVYRPQWSSIVCEAPDVAHQTRLDLLEFCASTGAVLLASHFAGSRAAQIERTPTGYAFVPVKILG